MFIFTEWPKPLQTMGIVHIASIISAILFSIGGGILAKKTKKSDSIYAITGISLIVLELLKVLFMLRAMGTYPLERIPFQICTVEVFFLWAVPFVKNEKIKKGMIAYTVIALMAAALYYVKPSTLLTSNYVFLSLQAVVWHNLVIMIGVFSVVRFEIYGKNGKNYFVMGYFFWLFLTFIAVIADVVLAYVIPEAGVKFFYLSPIQEKVVYSVFNLIFKEPKPYPLFLIGFIIFYSLGVALLYYVLGIIGKIREKRLSDEKETTAIKNNF